MIVDFATNAHESHHGVTPKAPPLAMKPGKFFHRPHVANLVSEYERKYGFERQITTSWAGSSATPYLDEKQIAVLRDDPLVSQVSQDTALSNEV